MTNTKKPIDLVEKLKQKYEKETKNSGIKTQETWLNVKSILYTSLIALAVTFVVIGGIVLIPLAILLIAGLMIFMIVKIALSEKEKDTDKDEDN